MKNLKFRIWDKVENKYIFITKREDYDWLAVAVEHPELYDVQQFTGLLDKQSKEIYEGDILKTKSRPEWDDEKCESFDTWQNGIVEMIGDRWLVKLSNGKIWDNGYTYEDWSQDVPWEESEVIGNVFENKNLIENYDNK